MYYLCKFIDASVTVLGGFFPIFILMYIHFLIRRVSYKKAVPIFEDLVNSHKKNKAQVEELLKNIFTLVKVKDLNGWIPMIRPEHQDLFNMANQLERDKFKCEMDIIEDGGKLEELRKYSFTDYITGILNKKYPDN